MKVLIKKLRLNKISIKSIPIILLFSLIVFELFYLNVLSFKLPGNEINFQSLAKEIVEKCKDANYRPTCYDREIPRLMDKMSMEKAFEVTKLVQDIDSSYTYCHVLGHELSAREVRNDPANWRDVLTKCPSGICSNGCLHGGLQEKFRGAEELTDAQIETLIPEFETVCEPRQGWSPTGLEQGSCYHALGHLNMYAAGADIPRALKICDRVAVKESGADWRFVCYDGVFMQMFQPLDPEDFALVRGRQPTRSNVDEFCEPYSGMQKASCQSESWPLFRKELESSPKGLSDFCVKTEEGYKHRCFSAGFYVVTSIKNFNTEDLVKYCAGFENEFRPQCFANVASRLIETDYRNIGKAMDVCKTGEQYDSEGVCYQEMVTYASYNFHPGSFEQKEICDSLPPEWKNKCISG